MGVKSKITTLLVAAMCACGLGAAAQSGCIDATNLTASGVACYKGPYGNPYQTVGMENYGSASAYSRHTVHTNTSELDPNTNNLLHTVPPGHTKSVRLGRQNAAGGAAASAISYQITVDTNDFGILILRYAAVLENPNHTDDNNPYFRFEIFDSSNQLIDSCSYGSFVSYQSLQDWNTIQTSSATIKWCDWQAVGFDLRPYHGQQISVRLACSMCSFGTCWAYTYFTLDCADADIAVSTCVSGGTITLTAPDGFNYRWYRDGDPTNPIGTERELDVPLDGSLYHCETSAIDRPDCSFTISAHPIVSHLVPAFDTATVATSCNRKTVNLTNRTVVANASATGYDTVPYTGTSLWDFGDGQTSTQTNPTVVYTTPGTYTITLTTRYLECEQTATRTIVIGESPSPTRDTVAEACDSIAWRGRTLDSSGTYYHTIPLSADCDSIIRLSLSIHPTQYTYDTLHFCHSVPLSYQGWTYTGDTVDFRDKATDIYGCDSTSRVALRHWPAIPKPAIGVGATADSIDGAADTLMAACKPATLWLRDTSAVAEWEWAVISATDTLDDEGDTVSFSLPDTGVYAYMLIRTDSNQCRDTAVYDSVIIVASTPEAAFYVSPETIPTFEPTAEFVNTSPTTGCTWLWTAEEDSATTADWRYTWPTDVEAGERPVQLIAYLTHCIETGDSCITLVCTDTVVGMVEIVAPYLDFPTLVTPNGDGVNDRWGVVGLVENGWFSSNEVWIFNQWGVLVFHAENVYEADQWWDPNATASPDGTYYFRFAARNQYGVVKRNGVIEVARGE